MKGMIVVAVVSVLSGVSCRAGELIKLSGSMDRTTGEKYYNVVEKARFATISTWNGVGEPPLSMECAVSNAVTWLRGSYGEHAVGMVEDCLLQRFTGDNSLRQGWYYVVEVSGVRTNLNVTPWHGRLVVLFNGEVVPPKPAKR